MTALNIAIGSSLQVALLVAPLLIFMMQNAFLWWRENAKSFSETQC